MKFCGQCGARNEDHASFCGSCGAKLIALPVPPVVQNSLAVPDGATKPSFVAPQSKPVSDAPIASKKKPKKKGLLIGILIVLVLTIAAGAFFLWWYFSPRQEALRALEAGDLQEVAQLVEEDETLRKNEEFQAALQSRIESLKTEFGTGAVEYTQLLDELLTMEGMEVENAQAAIEEARDYARRLHESRACFAAGEAFFESGDYPQAMAQYMQVIAEDSNYETAQARYGEAVNKCREKALADAEKSASAEDYAGAIRLLETALETLSGDVALTQQIALYEQAAKDKVKTDALADAQEHASGGDYDRAIQVLQSALETLPEDTDLTQQITIYEKASADQLISDTLAKAKEYADLGNYPAAMEVLEGYLTDQGENQEIRSALEDYMKKDVDATLEEAETAAAEQKYTEALSIIDEKMKTSDDTRLPTARQKHEKAYEASVAAQVDELLKERKYEQAKELINSTLKDLPDNETLTQKLEQIHNAQPVSLGELEPVESYRWNPSEPRLEDALGNEFYDSVNAFVPDQDGYAIFRIVGNYTRITGTVSSLWILERECVFKIYADDELIYSSKSITPATEPFTFDLEIPEGTEHIKLLNITDDFYRSNILLTDILLWP